MKAFILSLTVLVVFVSCIVNQQADEPEALTVSEFILQAEQLDSTVVSVIGRVDHICMGSRAKIHFVCPMHPEESIKIFADDDLEEFSDTLRGKVIIVTGLVSVSTKIDMAYLDKWEADLMKEGGDGHHQDGDEEEGHHHAEGVEEPETHHHGNQLALIAKYRKQVENSGKGYINLYKIVVSKVSPAVLPE